MFRTDRIEDNLVTLKKIGVTREKANNLARLDWVTREYLVWVVREYEDLAACLTIPPGDWEVDGWGWARSLFYVHNAYLHPYTDTGWRMCLDLAARYEVFKVETEDLIRVTLEKLAVGEE